MTRINQKRDVVLLLLIKEGVISIAVKDTDDYNKLKKQIGLLDFLKTRTLTIYTPFIPLFGFTYIGVELMLKYKTKGASHIECLKSYINQQKKQQKEDKKCQIST